MLVFIFMLLIPVSIIASPTIKSLSAPSFTYTLSEPSVSSKPRSLEESKQRLLKKYSGVDTKKVQELLDSLTDNSSIELQSTIYVLDELAQGSYSYEDAVLYVRWVTRLYLQHVSKGAYVKEYIHSLKHELLHTEFEFVARSENECGHSPAWNLYKKTSTTPFAILKESAYVPLPDSIKRHHKLCFSSFLKHIPDMPLISKVNEHELVGYEMDALFGLDRTPITFTATFVTADGIEKEGSLQLFVPDARSLFYYLEKKEKAKELLLLPASNVHLTAFSGILKGLMAHHIDNYLVRVRNKKPYDIIEIDLEESMPPMNRLENKALLMCRLAVLGLPQAKQPFSRALLLIITHPSFKALFQAFQEQNKLLHPDSLKAQNERFQIIQKLSSEALKQKNPSLSSRELYFAIFGGDKLYQLAKEKGYADITVFNNVVSDPYQHVVKDFMQPDAIKPSDALHAPKKRDSEKDKIRKQNLQILETGNSHDSSKF